MASSTNSMETIDGVKIGKNVLESLTRSAYDDCRCILREYVQNAADQIDIARKDHLSSGDSYGIFINIDSAAKRIVIEDNATGVSQKEVLPVLRNVACSQKDRVTQKGFRGIGRLGGLGYCTTLTFETTFKGEPVKSILKWNAAEMNRIIDDANDTSSASEVVEKVTSLSSSKEDETLHYFKIVMENVNDDRLLDIDSIRSYLSMVSPVEIASKFEPHRSKIKQFMEENDITLDTYNVYVNGEQIYKQYTRSLYKDDGNVKDEVKDVVCHVKKDCQGRPMYWMWYSLCKLEGIIDNYNVARGIRLRCKNIQLGSETNCRRFLPGKQEERFNDYFFGEIHILSECLIPDMDRNYLRVDPARTEFEYLVYQDYSELKKLCNVASDCRSYYKKIEKAREENTKFEEQKQKQSFPSEEAVNNGQANVDKLNSEAKNAQTKLDKLLNQLNENDSPISTIIVNAYGQQNQQDPIEDETVDNTDKNTDTLIAAEPSQSEMPASVHTPDPIAETKTFVRTGKPIYKKFDQSTLKVINVVYKVIGELLPMEAMRDAIISRIEEEITK